MKKRWMRAGLTLWLLSLISYSFAASRSPIPVQVIKAKQVNFSPTYETIGVVNSKYQLGLKPEVGGYINEINFKSGEYVKKGQPILVVGKNKMVAKYLSAKAQLNDDKLHLDQISKLHKKGYASQVQYNTVLAKYRTSLSQYQIADLNLKRSVIRAPFTGYLGLLNVSVGDLLQPSDVIVTLSSLHHLRVRFEVPQRFVHYLNVGDKVSVTSNLHPDEVYDGKVYAIDDRFSQKTAALPVLATIDNKDLKLRPHAYVKVHLQFSRSIKVIAIPQIAVQYSPQSAYVYTIQDGHAKRLNVKLGQQLKNGSVIVESGLQPGQVVIVGGLMNVDNNISVVINSQSKTASIEKTS